ncbi:hypothetical protein RHMOL_Rhmol08G0164400 [Rhododendron molle]|uniref:Uncharacterized protein n=1 Tax=Rhododendron molle TaxID=49168 RepID=A0ACC0MQK4_RHOML|nr:hypothetical protein RHMOL_Rhmol08G0164400 [Rhododendron molle]
MVNLLRMTLHISGELTATLVHGGLLDIMGFIESYSLDGNLEDHAAQAHRRFALSICALATYMLVSADARVSCNLVSIASQMGARKNITPLVLAETIMGMDLVYAGKTNTFSSSPLLLQIWLSDKIGLLEVPQAGWDHFPKRILQRPMLYLEIELERWFVFLNDLQLEEVVWRCPWLDLPNMVVHSAGFERMVITGLTNFTFYIPGRILRQLGLSQGQNCAGTEDFYIPNFNAQTKKTNICRHPNLA